MKNKGIVGFAVTLLLFSGMASAGVPNTPYSHDYDIGTIGPTHYVNNRAVPYNLVQDSYTFDLAAQSHVSAWLWNLIPAMGTIETGFTVTNYSMQIYNNLDQQVYTGETTLSGFGTVGSVHVDGILPAGNDYYAMLTGTVSNAYNLSYYVDLVATPVPEPETYAMLLAGLGLLGWRLRRA